MPIQLKKFNWLVAPSKSFLWVFIPLGYTLIIQTLTGFPKPETLKEISAHDFLLYISEELFNYPFWLQDLSHFPLFFVFAWLWTWFLRRNNYQSKNLVKSLLICISFAILNEFSQFFIPRRFPSSADVIMNLAGVIFSILIHSYFFKRRSQKLNESKT
mgnify:FL=1